MAVVWLAVNTLALRDVFDFLDAAGYAQTRRMIDTPEGRAGGPVYDFGSFNSLPQHIKDRFLEYVAAGVGPLQGFPWRWDVFIFGEDARGRRLTRKTGKTLFDALDREMKSLGHVYLLLGDVD